jgi:hypothetical protein
MKRTLRKRSLRKRQTRKIFKGGDGGQRNNQINMINNKELRRILLDIFDNQFNEQYLIDEGINLENNEKLVEILFDIILDKYKTAIKVKEKILKITNNDKALREILLRKYNEDTNLIKMINNEELRIILIDIFDNKYNEQYFIYKGINLENNEELVEILYNRIAKKYRIPIKMKEKILKITKNDEALREILLRKYNKNKKFAYPRTITVARHKTVNQYEENLNTYEKYLKNKKITAQVNDEQKATSLYANIVATHNKPINMRKEILERTENNEKLRTILLKKLNKQFEDPLNYIRLSNVNDDESVNYAFESLAKNYTNPIELKEKILKETKNNEELRTILLKKLGNQFKGLKYINLGIVNDDEWVTVVFEDIVNGYTNPKEIKEKILELTKNNKELRIILLKKYNEYLTQKGYPVTFKNKLKKFFTRKTQKSTPKVEEFGYGKKNNNNN